MSNMSTEGLPPYPGGGASDISRRWGFYSDMSVEGLPPHSGVNPRKPAPAPAPVPVHDVKMHVKEDDCDIPPTPATMTSHSQTHSPHIRHIILCAPRTTHTCMSYVKSCAPSLPRIHIQPS